MEHLPHAPDDSPSDSHGALERLQALFDKDEAQRQLLKQFSLELFGPPPRLDDRSAYLEWVWQCGKFYFDHGDAVSMGIVIEVLLEDHPTLHSLISTPGYLEQLASAYVDGADAIRRTLFELAGITP